MLIFIVVFIHLSRCHPSADPLFSDAIESFEFFSGSGWMAPPQIYEQARLMRLTDFNGAHRYAASREEFSSSRWLPVAVHADDGVLSVLPGDSLYPDGNFTMH